MRMGFESEFGDLSNSTGFFLDIPEMSGKQLGLLREVLPRLSRLAILGVAGLNAVQFAATEAAKALGLETEILDPVPR
jgi:putative tryptophan/tyrosine transport system substrate-binding protein